MRMMLATAIVFGLMLSGSAQAPTTSITANLVLDNGRPRASDVVVRFTDGSELRADSIVIPPGVVRRLTLSSAPDATPILTVPPIGMASVSGELKLPENTEFILSGNVRLKIAR